MWDPYSEFESTTLSNGLTVYSNFWPGRSWEGIGFVIHSGARQDPVGLEGLAHFIEHLVSLNTSLSRKEISVFFENLGGSINLGRTGFFDTNYKFCAPINDSILSKSFLISGNMLLGSKLVKSIESERKVIIGEFNREYPLDLKLSLDIRKSKILYPNQWLGRFVSPFGDLGSIRRITQEDLQSYYNANYTPANISVVGVGGMNLSELVGFLSQSPFGMSTQDGMRTAITEPDKDADDPIEKIHIISASEHNINGVKVGSYSSFAKIPGIINEQIVNIITHMLDEIIFEEVREKRSWTYSTGVKYCDHVDFYELSIRCDSLVIDSVDHITEVIDGCITQMMEDRTLFERIKSNIIAGNNMSDLNVHGLLSETMYFLSRKQRIVTFKEINDAVMSVTFGDIHSMSKYLSPEHRWTMIILP